MKITGIFVGFLDATLLCLVWLKEPTLASGQLTAPDVVVAAAGGSVTVACRYGYGYRRHTKYWCKGPVYETCAILVKTPRNRPSDRASIVDNSKAGVFTVTMTSLRDDDEDVYWCVVATFGINPHTRVKLLVSHTGTVLYCTPLYCIITPHTEIPPLFLDFLAVVVSI
ncbi:putative CMRF35-like molecule 3 [Scophthalmus maximus]|uniref:Putative CMRF35-like molecule 3 n=1 Tax=Scophthalmus maximus TaxID=52904 RepID=A0A2U9C2V0_SCOMX|nr:putative CMRF35-like molecule 3 [Scophthalmus maximus]